MRTEAGVLEGLVKLLEVLYFPRGGLCLAGSARDGALEGGWAGGGERV